MTPPLKSSQNDVDMWKRFSYFEDEAVKLMARIESFYHTLHTGIHCEMNVGIIHEILDE